MQGIAVILLTPAVLWSAAHSSGTLVAQLGSPSFLQREQAARQLAALDRSAAPALLLGLAHADLEVRDRCGPLLRHALRSELQRRMEALLGDPDCTAAATLPCWDPFRKRFGADPAARRAFVRMWWAEPELFECLADRPTEFNDAVVTCIREFSLAETRPSADQAEALLFLIVVGQEQLSTGNFACHRLLWEMAEHYPAEWKADALSETRVFRRLTLEFLRKADHEEYLSWVFAIAENLGLHEIIRDVVAPEVRRRVAVLRSRGGTTREIYEVWNWVKCLDLATEIRDDICAIIRQRVRASLREPLDVVEHLYLLRVVQYTQIQVGQSLALRLVTEKGIKAIIRVEAIQYLCGCAVGDEAVVASLEKLFDGEDDLHHIVAAGSIIGEIQLRDVALATAVFLSRQPLADYGFRGLRDHPESTPTDSNFTYFGFDDEKSRERAFALWAQRKRDRQKELAARDADPDGNRLLHQLGSASYQEREAAAARLLGLGARALPLLKAGQWDADPEVAERCRQLLQAR